MNGTIFFYAAMTSLYFLNLDLAFVTAAAPGKYDDEIFESLTNPLEGLFASIVVTSIRTSLLSILTTKSMRLFVWSLKQNEDSESTSEIFENVFKCRIF